MELQKDSLVELIVQLKATVQGQPDVARSIMMTHPQLAHAILKTMAELDIVDKDLFQKTVLAYAQSQTAAQPPAGMSSAAPAPAPAAALAYPTQPAAYHGPTAYAQPAPAPAPTPASTPALAQMYHGPGPAHPPPSHYPPGAQPQMYRPPVPQAPAPAPAAPAINPAILAAMTDEQRQAILHIVQMTPDQLALIPPAERATYIELRRQFGITS